MPTIRLQKLIAERGVASRRAAEKLISTGRVRVDGVVVKQLGVQVDSDNTEVLIDNKPIPAPPKLTTYLVNKPPGYVCSRLAQGKERLVTSLVPKLPVVYPVGRLDKESEGLILLSNDGQLTYQLTHPSFKHSREYQVEVRWKPADHPEPTLVQLTQQMRHGSRLGDGKLIPDGLKIEPGKSGNLILTIQVHEGRHHLIRRFCASFGYKVNRLERTAIGKLRDHNLKPGQSRLISQSDRNLLLNHEA